MIIHSGILQQIKTLLVEQLKMEKLVTYKIHVAVAGIFTYIRLSFIVNVGKSASPMDHGSYG